MIRSRFNHRALGLTLMLIGLALPLAASAQDAEPSAAPPMPDVQKQIEDALKELDKLQKINPEQPEKTKQQIEDVRQQMRQRLFQGFGGNGIFIGPGVNGIRRPAINQGRLGISLQRPPAVLNDQLKLPAGQGLIVADVGPDSPAEKAGLRKHDILVEWDGRIIVSDIALFQKDILDAKPGAEATAVILRHGQRETVKGIKLADPRPDPLALNPNVLGGESMRLRLVNDDVTIEYASGDLKATVKGTRENGKLTPTEIAIRDGETNVTARTLEEVPERYRATIDRMLARVR